MNKHPHTAESCTQILEELRRTLCAIGVVGEVSGHDVIRRSSVIELLDRRRAEHAASKNAAPEVGANLPGTWEQQALEMAQALITNLAAVRAEQRTTIAQIALQDAMRWAAPVVQEGFIGTSEVADFSTNAWTFTMSPGYKVGAGEYLITPLPKKRATEVAPS